MIKRLIGVVFWIIIWWIISLFTNPLLIPSPIIVGRTLVELLVLLSTWLTIFHSATLILLGLIGGILLGIICASWAAASEWAKVVLTPLVYTLKTIPVVSFILILLMWVGSGYLSIYISLLIVFPIIYINVLQGINNVNPQLLEMAKVFHLPFQRKLHYIYIPSIIPWFDSAGRLALGLSWKSGVAAEVIALSAGTIGEQLYESKIYLQMEYLFAWTVIIVGLGVVFEVVLGKMLHYFLTERRRNHE